MEFKVNKNFYIYDFLFFMFIVTLNIADHTIYSQTMLLLFTAVTGIAILTKNNLIVRYASYFKIYIAFFIYFYSVINSSFCHFPFLLLKNILLF